MKKILFPLLGLTLSLTTQALRADAPSLSNVGIECKMEKVIPKKYLFPPQLPKTQNSCYNIPLFLTEEEVKDLDKPIDIPLNSVIAISLKGERSNSQIYSSGTGDQHGYRWECDSIENDLLTTLLGPVEILKPSFLNQAEEIEGWKTQDVFYQWAFSPKQTGPTTLTFKKYYYSNAMVRNLDGSLPWKDPVKTIQFTINVVDGNVPAVSH